MSNGKPDYIEVVLMKRKATGADVEFRVSDLETKDPIEGALVEWGIMGNSKKSGRLLAWEGDKRAHSKTTDLDGSAWFYNVSPGVHPWLVTHEAYIMLSGITDID